MLSVTIEPGVFAPPFGARSVESVRAYVATLLHWRDAHESGGVELCVSESTAETLVNCDCYPLRPWLKTLLHETKCTEYDANTIATVAETLIARSASLEKESRIADLLFDGIFLNPSVFQNHVPPQLRAASERCALIIAIIRAVGKDTFSLCHGIVVRASGGASNVQIGASLAIIEHSGKGFNALGELPQDFEGSCVICEKFRDYILTIDECILWQMSEDNDDIEIAIRVVLLKSRVQRGETGDWGALPSFRLHKGFFDSVRASGALTTVSLARSSLRAIVEAIENLQLPDAHPLRTGAGGDDPQVLRGNDAAWRRDINYEYHLHYWVCTDARVELACVGPHGHLGIYF